MVTWRCCGGSLGKYEVASGTKGHVDESEWLEGNGEGSNGTEWMLVSREWIFGETLR